MTVWGNHSPTMYPDLFNAKVKGQRAWDAVDDEAGGSRSHAPCAGRGDHRARGASSAASAANAAIDHVRDWVGHARGRLASMAVCSDGSYGVDEGPISGFLPLLGR